jgi:hypothetical protein
MVRSIYGDFILKSLPGVNLPTEAVYFLKKNEHGELELEKSTEEELKDTDDMLIKDGVGFEIPTTHQLYCHKNISGDGTVPYASLHYPSLWGSKAKGTTILFHELEKADHRYILSNNQFFDILLGYATGSIKIGE